MLDDTLYTSLVDNGYPLPANLSYLTLKAIVYFVKTIATKWVFFNLKSS